MLSLIGFFKSLLGICETKPLDPALWSVNEGMARLKIVQNSDVMPKGGSVYLQGRGLKRPLLVIRTPNDSYLAFTNSCPHGHRKIDHVPDSQILKCCSVMHSTFDYEGKRLSGPAKENLFLHTVMIDGEDLVVKL